MADRNEGYWSRSWALLTMHDGWIKPVLALSAARMVPIVGPFAADGYALEWGRLTAWGVDAAPKQKGVDIGACILSGARAFVISLGYGLVLAVVNGILQAVLGVIGGFAGIMLSCFTGIVILIAKLRATIYQSIGAGYQVDRVADMIKRDSNGICRLVGLSAVIYAVIGIAGGIVFTTAILLHAGPMVAEIIRIGESGYVSDARMMRLVFSMIAGMLPTVFVLGFLLGIVNTVVSLILTTSTALWMRQFDVEHWGQSHDPLPGTAGPQAAATPSGPAPSEAAPSSWAVPTPTQNEGVTSRTTVSGGTTPQQAPEPTSVVPVWPVEPQAPTTGVPTFTLDDRVPTPAPTTEVPTFTLDTYGQGTGSAPQAQAPTNDVPTFTLDDMRPAGQPVEAQASAPATDVPAFTLDDMAPSSRPVEAQVSAPATDVPAFTLDDMVPTNRAVEPQPPAPVQPATEPYQGPVENDEDARKALASLELPVRPFDSVVDTGDEAQTEADAEPDAADDASVPTFTLEDWVDADNTDEASE